MWYVTQRPTALGRDTGMGLVVVWVSARPTGEPIGPLLTATSAPTSREPPMIWHVTLRLTRLGLSACLERTRASCGPRAESIVSSEPAATHHATGEALKVAVRVTRGSIHTMTEKCTGSPRIKLNHFCLHCTGMAYLFPHRRESSATLF